MSNEGRSWGLNPDSLSPEPTPYLYLNDFLVFFCMSHPGTPRPYKGTPPSRHDQPLPTTNPVAKETSHIGNLSITLPCWPQGHRNRHVPQKDPVLTLDQVPMPKELLSAIWCRYSSVLEAEKGPEVHVT